MQAMPSPAIRIDTGATTPAEAADAILEALRRIERTNACGAFTG
jgi:hypothetical protein